MRNQFLFLYPIKEYFLSCLSYHPAREIDKHLEVFNELIEFRYRYDNFEINWLMFGREECDWSDVPSNLDIRESDRKLYSGITFSEMCNYKYPDESKILEILPLHKNLVLGGFHIYDCVDRFAKKSYESGVESRVDEDLTNLGFGRLIFGKNIPLFREKCTIRALRGDRIADDQGVYKNILDMHRNKPWFVQERG